MQMSGVDFLPIKWQPALRNLGLGGSAAVSQALINIETSFAFKRLFFDGVGPEKCYERLATETKILRHISLLRHENVVRLEGYCCEILREPERISPVLIFEKFPLGNLQDFLLSARAENIAFCDKLGFCADIADALAALHRYHIIHGDIKPSNAYVYEKDGKRTVKLADLGDASICDDDEAMVFLPRSKPWNSPEHHYRGVPFWQATKMDIYSFGLVCLWILFGDVLSPLAATFIDCVDEEEAATEIPPSVLALARLKKSNQVQNAAREVIKAELEEEVRDIGVTFGQTHMIIFNLKRTLARILNSHGMYDAAATIQEDLVTLLDADGEKDNRIKLLSDLSHTYSLQDRLQLAERYRLEVVKYYTEHPGQEHMGTLASLVNLAHTDGARTVDAG
ncbi:MAG: hypothetical protein Q9167_000462 [Letrouitia subvulpina]